MGKTVPLKVIVPNSWLYCFNFNFQTAKKEIKRHCKNVIAEGS